jgi:flagellar biosynthesis/type III secretory pathway chaperone
MNFEYGTMKTSMMSINDKVDELLTVLDRDIRHIEESLSVLRQLRRLVLKRVPDQVGDTALSDLLQTTRQRKDEYTANESRRQSIRRDLADAFGCDIAQLTLTSLVNALSGEKKNQFAATQAKLKALIKELRKEHLSTAMLLSECIRFNNQLLRAIFDFGKTQTVLYGPGGTPKRQIDRSLVNLHL